MSSPPSVCTCYSQRKGGRNENKEVSAKDGGEAGTADGQGEGRSREGGGAEAEAGEDGIGFMRFDGVVGGASSSSGNKLGAKRDTLRKSMASFTLSYQYLLYSPPYIFLRIIDTARLPPELDLLMEGLLIEQLSCGDLLEGKYSSSIIVLQLRVRVVIADF